MKRLALVVVLILLKATTTLLTAQSKFGNATIAELEMTSYEQDTTASAVILNKEGNIRFSYDDIKGFQFEYTEQLKIKILKTDGLDFANPSIDYYVKSKDLAEEIRGLSGTTYNLQDGKIVKTRMSKENIFEEDTEQKWKTKKFTLPAAKVGSVVEYKYTIVSNFFYELRDLRLQSSIPIEYVSYKVIIPEYFIYNINQRGYVHVETADRKQVNETFDIRYTNSQGKTQAETLRCNAVSYIFKSSNMPAAKNEGQLWAINDYIGKVSFELRSTHIPGGFVKEHSSTWENIDKELLESKLFGDNLSKRGWFKDEIAKSDSLTIAEASKIEKNIKSRVQWNNKNSFYSEKLKDAWDKGIGSSADMNFLLINALKSGGFEAFPVILSTRSNGQIPVTHPSLAAFNYTITGLKIDDKYYFTDASDKFSTWNILPQKCMVENARALSYNRSEWMDLTKATIGTVLKMTSVRFADNKSIKTVDETRIGCDAYNARKVLSEFDSIDKFIEHQEELNNCQLENFVVTGQEDNSMPFKNEYVEKKDIDLSSEYIYYTLPLSKMYSENPFKSETRIFPINFNYLENYIQTLDIEIPEGYEAVELPKSEKIVLSDNDLSYVFHIAQEENVIKINSRFHIRKLVFLPSDYDYLKDFFAKILLKHNEQIVLKKI